MTPEERFQRLRDERNWGFRFQAKSDAAPAARRWAPVAVSIATIAVVAVAGVLVFSLFGVGVRSVRHPDVPAVPSPTASSTAGAFADDGSVALPQFVDVYPDRPIEQIVDLDGRLSLPWVKVVDDGDQLVIAYVVNGEGNGCGEHVGVDVTETDDRVTIAVVNTPVAAGANCSAVGQNGVGTVVLREPLGSRILMHAALSAPYTRDSNAIPTTPGPTIHDRVGATTCASLLDPATASALSDQGDDDISDAYAEKAMGSESEFHRFLLYGGLVCARSGGGSDIALAYAFGPITGKQAKYEKSRLVQNADGTYEYGAEKLGAGFGGRFAFGDGWWAYALDNGAGEVLDEVVRNGTAPPPEPSGNGATVPDQWRVPSTAANPLGLPSTHDYATASLKNYSGTSNNFGYIFGYDYGAMDGATGKARVDADGHPVSYTVAAGDRWPEVAQRFGINSLWQFNCARRNTPDQLFVGDTINLSPYTVATVGDANGSSAPLSALSKKGCLASSGLPKQVPAG